MQKSLCQGGEGGPRVFSYCPVAVVRASICRAAISLRLESSCARRASSRCLRLKQLHDYSICTMAGGRAPSPALAIRHLRKFGCGVTVKRRQINKPGHTTDCVQWPQHILHHYELSRSLSLGRQNLWGTFDTFETRLVRCARRPPSHIAVVPQYKRCLGAIPRRDSAWMSVSSARLFLLMAMSISPRSLDRLGWPLFPPACLKRPAAEAANRQANQKYL